MSAFSSRFAGKIALVTGAAQGIGETVAIRFAREGGVVVAVDRSELVHEVSGEIASSGGSALAITADLESYAGATLTAQRAREQFGRIDLLINNVGGTLWAMPYAEHGESQIEAEIRRSVLPTLWCCRAVVCTENPIRID
jgi:dihydroxycyclohexadiene carboxylate dehydrogenase